MIYNDITKQPNSEVESVSQQSARLTQKKACILHPNGVLSHQTAIKRHRRPTTATFSLHKKPPCIAHVAEGEHRDGNAWGRDAWKCPGCARSPPRAERGECPPPARRGHAERGQHGGGGEQKARPRRAPPAGAAVRGDTA